MVQHRIGNIIIEGRGQKKAEGRLEANPSHLLSFGYRCGSGYIAESKKCTSKPKTYTKPKLRDKLKRKITLGTKGGKSGQWSARKAQMLALAYKAAGGGYRTAKNQTQKSLKTWEEQDWQTLDGSNAIRTNRDGQTVTARYLPAKKWQDLTPAQAIATDRKKRAGEGQFVPNTKVAKRSN